MDFVHEIGLIKSASKESVYRPEREKEIIERLSALSKGKLNPESIKAIFQEIFAAARNIELPERVAYLGPEGSFTKLLKVILDHRVNICHLIQLRRYLIL